MMKKTGIKAFDIKVFFGGIIITCYLVAYSAFTSVEMLKRDARHVADVYSARSEMLLNSLFHKTDVVEAIVLANNGELSQSVFENVAKSLFDGDGIRAVQYLPGGIVEYCYPLQGNEAVIGSSVFNDPKRRKDALLALETRETALSGPYNLTQGGFGLIGRNPVFLTRENTDEKFLGFSVIILDLPAALKPIMLEELQKYGYYYRLYCKSEDSDNIIIIDQSKESSAVEPISCSINVPNHVWALDLMPIKGWIDWTKICEELLVGLLISFLLAVIFKQKRDQAKVLYQFAYTDGLTGLFNRRWLNEKIEKRLSVFTKKPFIIFYFDLNKFKQVNDSYGHFLGNELLREFGCRLRSVFGDDAALVRMGGDEFVAVVELQGGCRARVEYYKQLLTKSLAEPFVVDDVVINISASVGWAQFPNDGEDYDNLMKVADERMYINKRSR